MSETSEKCLRPTSSVFSCLKTQKTGNNYYMLTNKVVMFVNKIIPFSNSDHIELC